MKELQTNYEAEHINYDETKVQTNYEGKDINYDETDETANQLWRAELSIEQRNTEWVGYI